MSKSMDCTRPPAALALGSACGRLLGIGALALLLALVPKAAVAAERLSICHGSVYPHWFPWPRYGSSMLDAGLVLESVAV